MARSNRSACTHVINTVSSDIIDISRFSFFQLIELLCKIDNIDPAKILELSPQEEKIRFTSTASLGFPIRDLVKLINSKEGKRQLEVAFLGLHGSESPLPSYYLESLATEYIHKETKLVDFINLFNHRLVLLFHQIWRKYRYYINFKPGGEDEFSQRMFSLVGLGHSSIRNKLSMNHSKMLAYAGILSSPARSAEVICSLISHCFDLDNVTLKGWRFRYVDINEDEQNRLGLMKKEAGLPPKGRSCLGENFTLGCKIPDRGGKFELRLNSLTREEFLSFLPNGKQYLPLVTFISFVLKDQFAWDLHLGLKREQVSGMVLGKEQNSLLGWTSFVGKTEDEPSILISIRG